MKMKWKSSISVVFVVLFAMGICACSTNSKEDAKGHILGIAPITEVFPDGWKTTAIVLQYDAPIDSATLSASDFKVVTDVEGQAITRVYTNSVPEKAVQSVEGPYVILELSHDYIADTATATDTRGIKSVVPMGEGVAPNPIKQVGNISWDPTPHPATLVAKNQKNGDGKIVYIYQVGDIKTTTGAEYTAFENQDEAVANYWCRNLIVDNFLKPGHQDPAHGNTKYNIYFPENYDETKTYPVVVFLADENDADGKHAGVLTNGGIGGVVWADPAEQAKHECIVIVPAYREPLVDKNYESAVNHHPGGVLANSYLSILGTLDFLLEQVPGIDKNRVYLTGQGSGARAAMKMMIDRPYMFDASLLFAPDYDPAEMSKLKDADMWIVTSEADNEAAPSMDACMKAIEAQGKTVDKATWDAQAGDGKLAADVKDMAAQEGNIRYSVFKAGTLVPQGLADNSADNRVYTWRKGYQIEGLRDWLFTQKMTGPKLVDHVTTITKVFPDGQKPVAVAIQYEKAIRNASLDPGDFKVVLSDKWQAAVKDDKGGVNIDIHPTRIYANTAPETAPEGTTGVDGNYVIIELSTDYELPIMTAISVNGDTGISVLQAGDIATTDGETIPADTGKLWRNDTVHRLVVDDFRQFYYTDKETGGTLLYNLYTPENYDKTKSYPMVLFIHDASVVGDNIFATLEHCYGASIWATPAEQAKHECFVLAPQYAKGAKPVVNDQSEYSEALPMTIRMVKSMLSTYSIDPGKVYATGQSMGCMMSLAMMIEDHDLFSKALLVAGQWDAEKTRPLYDKNLWIVVSQGDLKAFPGMNASMKEWEKEGSKVYMPRDIPGWKGPNSWSATSSPAKFAAYVSGMLKTAGTHIKYTPLTKGTVVPKGQEDSGGNNHMYSFRRAYSIEGLRDWLLAD